MTQITFTGDIAFSNHFTGLADKEDLLSSAILAFLKDSDHVVANVEGPISSGEKRGWTPSSLTTRTCRKTMSASETS